MKVLFPRPVTPTTPASRCNGVTKERYPICDQWCPEHGRATRDARRSNEPRPLVIFCSHPNRESYEPIFSVGDDSDYVSQCCDCGAILRDAPTFYRVKGPYPYAERRS